MQPGVLASVDWESVPLLTAETRATTSEVAPGPPHLAALELAGTGHLYVDTADVEELAGVAETIEDGRTLAIAEIDGNTIDQPSMACVLERVLDEPFVAWLRELAAAHGPEELPALAYAAANLRVGRAIQRRFAAGRPWQTSLQLHMTLAGDLKTSVALGRALSRALPGMLVKVPFLPQQPQCLLAARDLERSGVLVNFTSTFSARQVAVAALLAGVTRTNVFAGRINQALSAEQLGEHVCLASQRLLARLRREHGIGTRLIVASVRDWRTLVRAAGCDAFTVPPEVWTEFLEQEEVPPDRIESRLEASYEDELGIAQQTSAALPRERIDRLHTVEPELLEFLTQYRVSREFAELADGDALWRRFDDAGFGDLFHAPSPPESTRLSASKLPEPSGPMARELALDTLFTLHADADFATHQEALDRRALERIAG